MPTAPILASRLPRRVAAGALLALHLTHAHALQPNPPLPHTSELTPSPETAPPAIDAKPPCRPISGDEVPALAALDTFMLEFLCEHDISAATVAITRRGNLIYNRAFGWSDQARTTPLAPDALMRIASVSKPITAAAVRELIAEGAFTLDTHAFDVGQPNADQPAGGLLALKPFPSLGDLRIADITVRHLLEHKGGWDRDVAGDLTYMELAIASAMGIDCPPGRENTLRFILGKPLQHEPGTKSAYSNIGMLALGLIVEQHRAQPLDTVLDDIMQRASVDPHDHAAGRTLKEHQDPREPWYDSVALAPSVIDPGTLVPAPYGSWDHEARIGQGGQITTAAALARFAARFYVNGPNIGMPRPDDDEGTWRWNHSGSLVGTNSLIRQRGDGYTFAVILNKRPSNQDWLGEIRRTIDAILDDLPQDLHTPQELHSPQDQARESPSPDNPRPASPPPDNRPSSAAE